MTNATLRVKGRCGREELRLESQRTIGLLSLGQGLWQLLCWYELYVPDFFFSVDGDASLKLL